MASSLMLDALDSAATEWPMSSGSVRKDVGAAAATGAGIWKRRLKVSGASQLLHAAAPYTISTWKLEVATCRAFLKAAGARTGTAMTVAPETAGSAGGMAATWGAAPTVATLEMEEGSSWKGGTAGTAARRCGRVVFQRDAAARLE